MTDEFSTKFTGTHSSIVLCALALSLLFIAPSCAVRSLRNLTGSWLQRRLLIYFPLAHLSHKSGLLRKHQFLFLVLLLTSVKPPKAPPGHCWLMMPLSPLLPLILLLVSDQNVPHSHSKLDFPVFYLQNSPEFVSPSQMLPRTNVKKSCRSPLWLNPVSQVWNMVFLRA